MRLSFNNKATPENIRVKIVAKNTSSIKLIGDVTAPGNNPTMVLNGGELVFCLAPVLTQGVWDLVSEFNVTNGIATYTAYKNIRSTRYFSHANLSLVVPIVRALQSEEIQQDPAVVTACNQLTNNMPYIFDLENNQISFNPNSEFMYKVGGGSPAPLQTTPELACSAYTGVTCDSVIVQGDGSVYGCYTYSGQSQACTTVGNKVNNPNYNAAQVEHVSFGVIAEKIISNSEQTFLEKIANSIFKDEQSRYVLRSDITPKFEDNIIRVEYKGVKENHVAVNKYTTSAIDFEQGLVDKIPNVTWQVSGNYLLQTTNVLSSTTSIETKQIGDSLYTTKELITGGRNPFTVEFEVLVKPQDVNNLPIFNKSSDAKGKGQGLYLSNKNTLEWYRHSTINNDNGLDIYGSTKINVNEINKISLNYDSSSVRCFINDKLDFVLGANSGFVPTDLPLRFLQNSIPSISYLTQTLGLLDNINIYNGYAKQVRNKETYSDKLVVDLSFDGENNSTKIVDNGSLKSIWTPYSSAKLSTNKKFDGYSSLSLDPYSYIRSNTPIPLLITDSFTISFSLLFNSFNSSSMFNGIFTNNRTAAGYRFQCCYTTYNNINSILIGYSDENGGSEVSCIVQGNLQTNKEYKIDLVFNPTTVSIYVDNKYNNSSDFLLNNNFDKLFDNGITIGSFAWNLNDNNALNGYIKNFKIYKGVEVIPENPSGKIQLDFNGNVLDKYNNSTWTNNNVTFNDTDSVHGSSAAFNGSNSGLQSTSDLLNYNNNNFEFEYDIKLKANKQSYALTNNINSNSSGSLWFGLAGQSLWLDFKDKPAGAYMDIKEVIPLNTYYNQKCFRKNGGLFLKYNDVLSGSCNLTNQVFNLAGGGQCNIGASTSTFGITSYMEGNLDNFKSYKEDLVNLNSKIYTTEKYGQEVYFDTSQGYLNQTYSGFTSSYSTLLRYVYVLEDSPKVIDFVIEAKALISSNNDYSCRINTNTNSYNNATEDYFGYSFYLEADKITFGKGSNNSTFNWVTISSFTFPNTLRNNDFHIFKIEKNDNTFKMYIDNVLYLTAVDSSHINVRSKIAFGGNNNNTQGSRTSKIESIKVSDLNGNVLYHKDWKTKLESIIDVPSVHLPLETHSNQIGYVQGLTINPVGNPVYTVMDGKKCIKIESGKYLNITSNQIFNVGSNSDFHLSMDFYYIPNGSNVVPLIANSSGQPFTDICVSPTGFPYIYRETSPGVNTTSFASSVALTQNAWNKIVFKRKGIVCYFEVNGTETLSTLNFDINFSLGSTYIGNTRAVFGLGYISNFKLFTGVSSVPSTYNPYRVLDLDFKPTRKSYLFKDNNNKCIIHPVNITYRDYLRSQYCCTFNGTDQYLKLGNNPLLNFDKDDFVFNIKFEITSFANTFSRLISNNIDVSSVGATSYVMITGNDYSLADKRNKLFFGLDDNTNTYVFSNKTIELNTVYDVKIVRHNGVADVYINDELDCTLTSNLVCNFNTGNNTYIGTAYATNSTTQSRTRFKGTIYHVRAIRNTSDVTLLEDVWVDPFPPEPEVPPFEEGVLNFTELLKDVDPHNVVLDFKQLRYT